MKLHERHLVEGTEPSITIGHRVRRDPITGQERPRRPYVGVWSEHGRKFCESLKTTNKAVAIRRAHDICRRIHEGEAPKPKAIELNSLVELYLGSLRGQDRSPRTLGKYNRVLKDRLVLSANDQGVRYARDFRERHFWALAESFGGLSPKTKYTELTVIKQLFRWGHRDGLLSENPVARCRLQEPEPTRQFCYSKEQVATLLDGADAHLEPIISFLAYTGARFGEARDLCWSEIDFDAGSNGFVTICRGGSNKTTKSKRSRRIPLHPELRSELKKLQQVEGFETYLEAHSFLRVESSFKLPRRYRRAS